MKYTLYLLLFANYLCAQQILNADFKSATAKIQVDPATRMVSGDVAYDFTVLKKSDTIRIDAINMTFSDVEINKKRVKFATSAKALLLFDGIKKGRNRVTFHYSAQPKQTMYFVAAGQKSQVWTQGQGKYTSHWFPSFDDTKEKVIFNLSVTANNGFEVIANGALSSKKISDGQTTWNYTMQHPMSSYLLMVAIGKFGSKMLASNSGIPIQLYIEPEDTAKWEPTYRYSKQVFDFLENEIGVAYPWQVYKQVPVRDFLYAGMENTTATVFARDFVVDSVGYNDRNYVNVNAHELAHQWFGDMVTATSGEHHWLQEGFATYYALLAERSVFGDDYFYSKMYDMAENLQAASKTDTIPLLNAKASSLTFYQKGAWALHVLRESIGDAKFRLAVQNYLKKYQFKNVQTDYFLAEIRKVSDFDTQKFKREWLESGDFKIDEALALLKKNAALNRYFEVSALESRPFAEKRDVFLQLLKANESDQIKAEIIFQLRDVPFSDKAELIRIALASKNIRVRQMVAKTLKDFPRDFLPEFESLLNDESYITQEIALNVIWSQFVDRRIAILDKTSDRIGMNDKNLRILWLTLALATSDYHPAQKAQLYDELLAYSRDEFESSVRMNAIENLLYIDKNDSNVLLNLVNLTTHHKWQVTQFARQKIRELLKNKKHRPYFTDLMPQLSQAEQVQLQKLLNE